MHVSSAIVVGILAAGACGGGQSGSSSPGTDGGSDVGVVTSDSGSGNEASVEGGTEAGPGDSGGVRDATLDGEGGAGPGGQHPIAAGFFGMHTNTYGNGFPFGAERLWDSGTAWSQIQTAATTYDFSSVQSRVADANGYGFDLLYTFGRTPPFLAKKSTVTCDYGNDGQCDPPDDVAADGTGTDAHVKAFWTHFMATMCTGTAPGKTCGPIKYFETWNEPNADQFWSGTYAQLARMSADATTIIKSQCSSCTVLTPGVACGGDGYHANGDAGQCDLWLAAYLLAWQKIGPPLADAGAWHPYPAHTNVSPSPFPETNVSSWDACTAGDNASCTCKAAFVPNKECRYAVVDQIKVLRATFDAGGLAGKPMVATEGGWNEIPNLPDPDLQAAFLARWYAVQAGAGVEAAFWYAEDSSTNNGGWGRLLTSPEAGAAGPNLAGTAYEQLVAWLVGGSVGACAPAGTVWSCPTTDKNGTKGLLLWDTAESCANGTCTTHSQPVASTFTTVSDLAGDTAPITGGAVSIGAKPVLIR